MDNYEKQAYTGRKLFLKYDQDKLIEKYGLKHDEEYLYLKYIGTEYRIDRGNGAIEYVADDEWTDCREYTIVMTIYDFLCCSGQEVLPPLTGQWQPVSRFVTAGSSPSTAPFVEKYAKALDKNIFPGIQGGPLMHIIAAKAECFYEALQPSFVTYQKQVLKNIKALSDYLISKDMKVISGGTDNHLILLDVYNSIGITGKEAEAILDSVHITVNKNTIPNETLSPMKASGIRIGSPAMTTRGLKEDDFALIGDIIYNVLNNYSDDSVLEKEKCRVLSLTSKYKMYD